MLVRGAITITTQPPPVQIRVRAVLVNMFLQRVAPPLTGPVPAAQLGRMTTVTTTLVARPARKVRLKQAGAELRVRIVPLGITPPAQGPLAVRLASRVRLNQARARISVSPARRVRFKETRARLRVGPPPPVTTTGIVLLADPVWRRRRSFCL